MTRSTSVFRRVRSVLARYGWIVPELLTVLFSLAVLALAVIGLGGG